MCAFDFFVFGSFLLFEISSQKQFTVCHGESVGFVFQLAAHEIGNGLAGSWGGTASAADRRRECEVASVRAIMAP